MVYMFLADGFEEIEAITPLDILRRCGVEVRTVGVTGESVTGAHGIPVKADMPVKKLDIEKADAEMIILPGGGVGVKNLSESERVLKAVEYCAASGIYTAAICAAPSVFGQLGLLDGKKATCYPDKSWQDKCIGAKLADKAVVIDGRIITSMAAGTSEAFGFALAEILRGEEKAQSVYKSMQCGR